MELAMIVGTNPRNVKRGPRVRVQEGKWKLRIDGQKDSIMNIHLHHEKEATITSPAINGTVVVIDTPRTAEIEFVSQGNEASISVFAELL